MLTGLELLKQMAELCGGNSDWSAVLEEEMPRVKIISSCVPYCRIHAWPAMRQVTLSTQRILEFITLSILFDARESEVKDGKLFSRVTGSLSGVRVEVLHRIEPKLEEEPAWRFEMRMLVAVPRVITPQNEQTVREVLHSHIYLMFENYKALKQAGVLASTRFNEGEE